MVAAVPALLLLPKNWLSKTYVTASERLFSCLSKLLRISCTGVSTLSATVARGTRAMMYCNVQRANTLVLRASRKQATGYTALQNPLTSLLSDSNSRFHGKGPMPYSSNWKLAGALNLLPTSEMESPKTTIYTAGENTRQIALLQTIRTILQ